MANGDEYVAIQKLTMAGVPIYLPEGQEFFDTIETLERDGLVSRKYDEHGKYVRTIVHDAENVRVLCWQLTVNAAAHRRGREPVFTDLKAELIDHGVQWRGEGLDSGYPPPRLDQPAYKGRASGPPDT